ncbi:MAG: hypothetical protein LBO04_03505 [Spirochaetaceae bacterium]|jgi:hypothetical protein|nr:hypothetical protein [Spirochaetaceae bacterium]
MLPIWRLPALVTEDGNMTRLELSKDIAKAVRETYNAKYGSIFLETLIRTLAKYASAYAISGLTAQSSDNELAGMLAGLAAKVTFDATECADIRMERYLPAKAWIGVLNLPPDTHTVTINYYSGSSRIKSGLKTIRADIGRLDLVEGVCLQ